MADIPKIKRNIQRMIDAGAPESDLDAYVSGEGVTIEQLQKPAMRGTGGTWEEDHIVPDPMEMVKNSPSSALKFAKGVGSLALHPEEALKGVADLTSGLIEKIGRATGIVSGDPSQQEQGVDQINASLQEVIDNPGGYVEKDPIGAFLNLSGALGGASKFATMQGLAKTGAITGKVAELINPITGPLKGLSWVSGQTLGRAAPRLYASAIKIPPSIDRDIRVRAIDTGLDERYLPTDGGLNKLRNNISVTENKIWKMLDHSTQSGNKISSAAVSTRLDELKMLYDDLPEADKRPILNSIDAYQKEIAAEGYITPMKAKAMKQALYKQLKDSYGELQSHAKEQRKTVARGLKEELVSMHPEIAELDHTNSARMNLEKVLDNSVNRIENYDVFRIGDVILTAGGAPVSVIAARRIFEAPVVKARLALALREARKQQGWMAKAGRTPLATSVPFMASEITQQ